MTIDKTTASGGKPVDLTAYRQQRAQSIAQAQTTASGQPTTTVTPASGDKLDLSTDAQLFLRLKAALQQTPQVRADVVAQAKADIAQGTPDDLTALAVKLLSSTSQQ